jgi:hypothetical protein
MTILRSTIFLSLALLCTVAQAFVAPQASRRAAVVLADTADIDLQGIMQDAASSFSVDTAADVVPSLPSVEEGSKVLQSLGLPVDSMVAAGAVAAVVVLLAVTLGGGGGGAATEAPGAVATPKAKSAVKQNLLAIPYDAAARLAYDAWRAEKSETPPKKLSKKEQEADDLAFSRYKAAYEEAAVAEVIAKKKSRDMASFDPTKAVVVAAPRVVKAPKVVPAQPVSTAPAPFFADAK